MTVRLRLDSGDHVIGSVNVHTLVFGVLGTFGSSGVNWFPGALLGNWDKSRQAVRRVRVQGGCGLDWPPDIRTSVGDGKEYTCAGS